MKKTIESIKEKIALCFTAVIVLLIIGFLLFSIARFVYGAYLVFSATEYTKVEICALRNDEEITSRGLYYARIDTNEYIHYWVQINDELIPNKVKMNICRIFEDLEENETPYINLKKSILVDHITEAEIHVPKGTVMRQIELK